MAILRRNLLMWPPAFAAQRIAAAVPGEKLKILVTGGHPGDPECGCGGTVARFTESGHEAVLLYLNRGEGYCNRPDLTQCAAIRTNEALSACKILKARGAFAGQYDGRAVVDNAHYADLSRLLDSEKPDLVFVHWPIDRHRDHVAISTMMLDCWLRGGKKAALYFYEVADDTMMFAPTEYVDISRVEGKRRAACFAHASQQPDRWYPRQTQITRFRGIKSGFAQAEGFLRHSESKRGWLP